MTARPPTRRPRYLAGAPLALVALASLLLLGATLLAPQTTPVAPVSLASPSVPAPSQALTSPAPTPPTASPFPSPTPEPATPLPSSALATPFEEYYPSIAPSTPLADGSSGNAGSEGGSGSQVGAVTTPGDGRATRVVIPTLRIDLPVVAGDLRVRGNRDNYPLCDVAQYMTVFGQPGHEGTAYVYAHAQRGMFLPMLRASWRNNGREMIGARVEVYTSDSKLHIYEIVRVKRHSTNLNIAFNVAAGQHQLVLQTSEGPPGHKPVLQVKAKPIMVVETSAAAAMPAPRPRACLPRR